MKQRLKYLPILIYPYWCYLGFLYWGNFDNGFVYKLFLFTTPVVYIAAFVSSIILLLFSLKKKRITRNLALRNFFYKLLHIPPLFMIFITTVASGGYQPHDMEDAFNFAVILVGILIFITGVFGIAAIFVAYKERKYSKLMIPVFVILGLGQFIFIIDVIAALILLIISFISKRKEQQKMSISQGDPA